jgi:hypothetical protein
VRPAAAGASGRGDSDDISAPATPDEAKPATACIVAASHRKEPDLDRSQAPRPASWPSLAADMTRRFQGWKRQAMFIGGWRISFGAVTTWRRQLKAQTPHRDPGRPARHCLSGSAKHE